MTTARTTTNDLPCLLGGREGHRIVFPGTGRQGPGKTREAGKQASCMSRPSRAYASADEEVRFSPGNREIPEEVANHGNRRGPPAMLTRTTLSPLLRLHVAHLSLSRHRLKVGVGVRRRDDATGHAVDVDDHVDLKERAAVVLFMRNREWHSTDNDAGGDRADNSRSAASRRPWPDACRARVQRWRSGA